LHLQALSVIGVVSALVHQHYVVYGLLAALLCLGVSLDFSGSCRHQVIIKQVAPADRTHFFFVVCLAMASLHFVLNYVGHFLGAQRPKVGHCKEL